MKVTGLIVTAGSVMALAACGSGIASSTAAPASRVASSAAQASAAPAPVDTGTPGLVCAGLNAMTFEGDSGADAISTVASAYHLTQAQVVAAIDERCPQLKRIVSAGA